MQTRNRLEVLVGTVDYPFALVGHSGVDAEQIISFNPRLNDARMVCFHVIADTV